RRDDEPPRGGPRLVGEARKAALHWEGSAARGAEDGPAPPHRRLRGHRARRGSPRLSPALPRGRAGRGLHLRRSLSDLGQEHRSRLPSHGNDGAGHGVSGRLPRQARGGRGGEDPLLQANANGLTAGPTMSAKDIKDDRQYTKDHEWAKQDGSEFLIGISAFAVDQLGDITMVSLDVQEGDEIQKGQAFGTIESVKTLSDLFAPLSGKVTRINPNLDDQPELVNADPWGQGWMLALEPSAFDAQQGDLLDAEQYGKHLEDSDH